MTLDQILQIRITEEERTALEEIAEKDERSLSFIIRQAIRHEIERHTLGRAPHGTQAKKIREYCQKHYIEPARARGAKEVMIHIGTVAREMGLTDRLPAVIAAIGANKFLALCNLDRVSVTGPAAGARIEYLFKIK